MSARPFFIEAVGQPTEGVVSEGHLTIFISGGSGGRWARRCLRKDRTCRGKPDRHRGGGLRPTPDAGIVDKQIPEFRKEITATPSSLAH